MAAVQRPIPARAARSTAAGPPRKPSKAEREQEMRAEARAERLHLAGVTNAGVIIMSVVLAAMVVMLVLATHH
ncbi:MAG: hypothetical protein ACRDOK_20015 [Streptosporangiaceae bacterium]